MNHSRNRGRMHQVRLWASYWEGEEEASTILMSAVGAIQVRESCRRNKSDLVLSEIIDRFSSEVQKATAHED